MKEDKPKLIAIGIAVGIIFSMFVMTIMFLPLLSMCN